MKKLFVIFASIALVAAFAVSASAADWSLYGSARMATFMIDDDFGDKTFANNIGDTDDDDLQWDQQGNSRIGARVKNENVSGRFEYGTGVNLRLLYGEWDTGSFKLLLGQDYTPVSQFISGQAFDGDIGLLGMGAFYGSRRQQVKLTFGDLQIALIKPGSVDVTGGVGDVDEELPAIEAKWGMTADMFSFNIRGGYQSYDIDMPTGAPKSSYSVDSQVIAADATVNMGPLYVKAAVSQGTNIGVPWFGYSERDVAPGFFGYSPGVPIIDGVTGELVDIDTMQYAVAVGFKLSDTATLEGGIGFKEDDPDKSAIGGFPVQADDMISYYAQLVLQLAPGVWLIPEFGMFDYGDTIANIPSGAPGGGSDSGDTTYYGAKWQIDF